MASCYVSVILSVQTISPLSCEEDYFDTHSHQSLLFNKYYKPGIFFICCLVIHNIQDSIKVRSVSAVRILSLNDIYHTISSGYGQAMMIVARITFLGIMSAG